MDTTPKKFYLGLALDEKYVEELVEGCLERIGEDDAEERNVTFLLEAVFGSSNPPRRTSSL